MDSPRARLVCVASVDIGSSIDADIPGLTIMDYEKRRITFYPTKYIKSSPNGVFRLFCEGIKVPSSAKYSTTITVRVYETIIPFSWAPAPGQSQNDYVFPTRTLYLENADVTTPRISRTLAPQTALLHTIRLEAVTILSQTQITAFEDIYRQVISAAIRTGNIKPTAVSDAATATTTTGTGTSVATLTATTSTPTSDTLSGSDASSLDENQLHVVTDMDSSDGISVLATYQRILYRLRVYRNALDYRKVWIDNFGNFEWDITLQVTVLIETLSGTTNERSPKSSEHLCNLS
jgi:hypothetical protein